MLNIEDSTLKKAVYQQVVDSLEKDGAICNFSNKSYNVTETYEGGYGLRKSFYEINKKINFYQDILSDLTGEIRAKIFETMPVIDYYDLENTGFANEYPFDKDPDVFGTIINKINFGKEEDQADTLTLLEDEDPYTINRVLLGQPMAEHFYNTTSISPECYNIQVSGVTSTGNLIYYNGVRHSSFYTDNTNPIAYCLPASDILTVYYNITTSSLTQESKYKGSTSLNYCLLKEETLPEYFEKGDSSDIKIFLSKGDILFFYISDPNNNIFDRLLFLKEDEGKYIPYILDILNFEDITFSSNSCELIKVECNELISEKDTRFGGKDILSILENYFILERDYSANASGLLNGLFCEPRTWTSGLNSRVITKWDFINDYDIAKERNTHIEYGTKYNSGHILNRGYILEGALKTTRESNYKGKATAFYDAFYPNQGRNTLPVETISNHEWISKNSTLYKVNAVVTEEDYSASTVNSTMVYPKKTFSLDYDTFTEYIDNFNRFFTTQKEKVRDDGKQVFNDETGESEMEYSYYYKSFIGIDLSTSNSHVTSSIRETQNEFLSEDTVKNNGNESSANNDLSTNINTLFKISYTRRYKINGYNDKKIKSNFNSSRVNFITPYELISKENASSAETYLVYFGKRYDYPKVLFLVSKRNLKLVENQSCSFYDKDKGFIICKVNNIVECKPSNIKYIHYKDDYTEETIWKRGIDEIFYNYVRQETDVFSAFENRDCYVYTLSAEDMSKIDVTVYDADDKEIDFSKITTSTFFLSNFFNEERDLSVFKNFTIINCIPKNISSLKDSKDINSLLQNFSKDVHNYVNKNESYNDIYNYILCRALGDFKISKGSSGDSVLYLKDVSKLIDSITNIKDTVSDIVDAKFTISLGDTTTVVTRDDFEGLLSRINESNTYDKYVYDIKYEYDYKLPDDNDTLNQNWLNNTVKEKININTFLEGREKLRLPYKEIKKATDKIANGKGLSKEDCLILDDVFGNNTEPFLRYGIKVSDGSTSDPNILSYGLDIKNFIVKASLKAINNVGKNKQKDQLKVNVETLKKSYKTFYTQESIEKSVTEDGTITDNFEVYNTLKGHTELETLFKEIDNNLVKCSQKYLGYYTIQMMLYSITYKTKLERVTVLNFFPWYKRVDTTLEERYDRLVTKKGYLYDRIVEILKKMISSRIDSKAILNANGVALFSEDEVKAYYTNANDDKSYNFAVDDRPDTQFIFRAVFPDVDFVNHLLTKPSDVEINSDDCAVKTVNKLFTKKPTIYTDVLEGLADYIKQCLEGTDSSKSNKNTPYIEYTSKDKTLFGRKNGLYYKRYNYLNARMNTLKGSLYKAGFYIRNLNTFNEYQQIGNDTINTYGDFIKAIPVSSMDELTYLPTQYATMTTVPISGKFYSKKELDALRNLINSKCALTCMNCSVKDGCPFYDEEQNLLNSVSGQETIDLYLKDNELELIISSTVELKHDNSVLNFEDLNKDTHKVYSKVQSINKGNGDIPYDVRSLQDVVTDLHNNLEPYYGNEVQDSMSWLLGGRYGSVQENDLKKVKNKDTATQEKLYTYRYMYDTLFLDVKGKDSLSDSSVAPKDDDSYISYSRSKNKYNVSLTYDGVEYKGTTKIKVPVGLKLLNNCGDNDDLYLVSDDVKDSEGLEMKPVIYLGPAKDVKFAFDLIEDSDKELRKSDDTNIYAKDVAQWCVNYIKGNMAENPISGYENKDQYWMEKVYKKIDGSWCEFEGRPRELTSKADIVMDANNIDEVAIISGHPMVNNYINFLRKVHIKIYDNEKAENGEDPWCIPFVKKDTAFYPWNGEDDTYEKNVEIQKKVLSLMKTNLRLVLIKK